MAFPDRIERTVILAQLAARGLAGTHHGRRSERVVR